MCELSEIEAMLRAHEEGLCSSIMRSIGSSAVTLFGVFDEKGKDRLELAGSGSLVVCGGSHYILTAAHLWEKVLRSAVKVGITMTDNIDHQHLTDVAAIIPTTLPLNDARWNEWGPDLAMLRIPQNALEASRRITSSRTCRPHPGFWVWTVWSVGSSWARRRNSESSLRVTLMSRHLCALPIRNLTNAVSTTIVICNWTPML